MGKLTLKPGIRAERIWQGYEQFAPSSEKDMSANFNLVAGGGSFNYEIFSVLNQ